MKLFHCAYFCFVVLILASCAIQVPPSGGPADVNPPHLLSSEPEYKSTLFTGQDIRLDFDEYINPSGLNSQLIVSPLLKYPPETKIRKKSLLIHFQDTLLENTTYTMNFGEGVSDNNEGNKLENFQFVFSTGPVVDTLSINGKIKRAFDEKPEKGTLALLYRDMDDSIPYLQKPSYFSTTDDSGNYRINNISPGAYKLIALKEANGDYLYTQGEELIGFPDSKIEANSENVNLSIFREDRGLVFLRAYSEFPGKAVLVFSSAADSINLKWLSDTSSLRLFALHYSKEKDTLNIFYKNVLADSLNLLLDNGKLSDTVSIRLFKRQDEPAGRKSSFAFSIGPRSGQTEIQHLYLPYFLHANHPVEQSDFSKIVLLEDSVPVKPKITFTDSLMMDFNIDYRWKSKGKYSIFIPPGTFTDIYGTRNDTIQISFRSHGETDYGSVKVNFRKSDNDTYVLQLIDEADIVHREIDVDRDSIIELVNLDPKIYRVKLIHDNNRNGKWDTGNYLKHIQPELVEFFPESITVRANWDVDISIKAPMSKAGLK